MEIRPAATLALTRDTADGLEVLLLQRTWDAVFLPGFHVFPGGAVDAADNQCRDFMEGHDDTTASAMLNLDHGGAGYLVAAIRECFEEAGILLAVDADDRPVRPDRTAVFRDREAVSRGELSVAGLCERHHLKLPLDRLAYLSHWITPPGPPRRFDTRFFVAAAPAGQVPGHDGVETIDHVWLSPKQALEDHRTGRRLYGAPTLRTLRVLAGFDNTEALIAHTHAQPPEPFPSEPWPALDRGDQPRQLEPGAPAYDEVRKLDPQRSGSARAAITPGLAVTLAPGVQRLTAPNPGAMTGPGTNSYILGHGGRFTVIDPGPADERHIAALLALTGSRIERILVTHTHRDHSPAAGALREATGAELMGMPAPDEPSQDRNFTPDRTLAHGEVLDTGAGRLKVIHTPGHASNHLCYLLEPEQMLFSGDHIMQGSTVVINPPDGDMGAYLRSLADLLQEDIRYIAPGHGFIMANAHAVIDYLTSHRLAREHKVVEALRHHGPARLADLTPKVYDDVSAALHGVASRSLLAHLIKLEEDGRARLRGEHWQLSDSTPA
ncbi:MAG: MBL fold metallo-hydrolase [Marinobacter sp.]|uniref:MBL fold metallo-hydrolase n=1 Tax=Marinobacter sp. TaxID=50741 RepID=UPI00299DF744|nr:MBL fold metallo-hydrolase [Marinobacter sp.]MDX1634470.1 MBL fold metallo-hydrolase [Marinobacter sp.]